MVPFKARAIDFLVIRKLRMKLDLAKVDTFVGRVVNTAAPQDFSPVYPFNILKNQIA